MPVDWKSSENNERLLACLFASLDESGTKINYKRIAQLFGQGTTGNAIDCNFRKIRAAAKEIKKECEAGATVAAPPATPRKPKTTKKDSPLSGVKGSRVEKMPALSKKTTYPLTKQEVLTPPDEEGFPIMDDFAQGFDHQMGDLETLGPYDNEI